MWDCATPATWNQGGCHQVPRLPRRSAAAPRASRATKPGPSAPPSAMSEAPATQNDRGCAIVPRLPREIKVDVTKCHACHAEVARRHVTKCHACHAEVARRHGRHARLNRAQARHPVPWVKRLPRKTTVDVRLSHACHAKRRWMSPRMSDCATPATQNGRGCEIVPRLPRKVPRRLSATPCEVIVCERWYVTKLCVCECVSVCEVIVC